MKFQPHDDVPDRKTVDSGINSFQDSGSTEKNKSTTGRPPKVGTPTNIATLQMT